MLKNTNKSEYPNNQEHELSFHVSLPFVFSFWVSFERFFKLPGDWQYYGAFGRQTGIRFFDDYLWLSFWHNDDGCHHAGWLNIPGLSLYYEKHGVEIAFNPADFFLGRSKYTTRDISITEDVVTLPEASYPVKVRMFESTWKRPRWPKVSRLIRADVEPVDQERGIPAHAGKGENSWDLDDDALFGSTLPADSPGEAAKMVAESILRDRKKYGDPDCIKKAQAKEG